MARELTGQGELTSKAVAAGASGLLPAAAPEPVRVLQWSADGCRESWLDDPADGVALLQRPGTVGWLELDGSVAGPGWKAVDELVGERDARGQPQERPRLVNTGRCDLLVVRRIRRTARGRYDSVPLRLFVGDRWIVTVTAGETPELEPVRARMRAGAEGALSGGPGHVAADIVGLLMDGGFPLLEKLGDRLEALEQAVMGPLDKRVMQRIHDVRHSLLVLRRAAWPLRDALAAATREPRARLPPEVQQRLRQCHDQVVQVLDLLENYREISAGLVELYLSSVGARTNEVMKVLAIISTIFLPLSFIAGVYGMNFDTSQPLNMPELHWAAGYPFALGLMGVCALVQVAYFWRRGWLGRANLLMDDETSESLDVMAGRRRR